MKFTLSWLKEYLETKASLEEICETLTNIGLEVESVEDKAKILAPFSVAKIIEAKAHENSNKLKICSVQTSDSANLLQIVCGAANARSGIKVAYAPIGAIIPANQMVIKKAKIAGIESNGMLCSAKELNIGNEDSGIIEIAEKWEIGSKITEVYALEDALIEINVTPNRGDCLGIAGIARDLSASGIGAFKKLELTKNIGDFSMPLKIENTAKEACPHAKFRYIKNIKNCESPKWLKEKLHSVGINSISAIVDITNYVMLCLNRPMHAYDAAKIDSGVKIRYAQNKEKFISLKNEEFELDEKILVISDAKNIVGVAGVIGSKSSSCDLETTEILLESAFFQPTEISYSGRKLNILSDARFRFERGIDENSCEDGLNFATQLILQICGGQASEIKAIDQEINSKKIQFNTNKIAELIGIEISNQQSFQILKNLGFNPEKKSENELIVTVPTHRHDISQEQDLIEEVARIYGYKNIISKKLPIIAETNSLNLINKARRYLASQGMTETISWSFIDENLAEIFAEKNLQLTLQNPISIEMNHMRPSLAIGLIESYKKNVSRNFSNLSLFEIGNIFDQNSQKLMIAGIRAGKNKDINHYHDEREFDVFDVKKDLLGVIEIFGLRPESLQISELEAPKYYHPHRSATLKLGKNLIGFFGEISPKITKKFDLKNRINIFEIFADNLPSQTKAGSLKAFTINDFPVVERDFAFLVNKNQPIGDMMKTIQNCDKQLIKEVEIFDIFSGKNIAEDKKSVALRVKIQAENKTMTSEEIEIISQKIISSVAKFYGASLRE